MKYSLCVLCLFFVFSFVLNKSEVIEFKDGVEQTIEISEKDLYIGLRIPKNGHITLDFKKKQDHQLVKDNFKFGLSPSLSKDCSNYSNDIKYVEINDAFNIIFSFDKGDNEYVIVHIDSLTPGKSATIKIGFYTTLEGWAIAAIVLGSLLCVIIIIICIIKKCCRCC